MRLESFEVQGATYLGRKDAVDAITAYGVSESHARETLDRLKVGEMTDLIISARRAVSVRKAGECQPTF